VLADAAAATLLALALLPAVLADAAAAAAALFCRHQYRRKISLGV
jgi:hypothetical protein